MAPPGEGVTDGQAKERTGRNEANRRRPPSTSRAASSAPRLAAAGRGAAPIHAGHAGSGAVPDRKTVEPQRRVPAVDGTLAHTARPAATRERIGDRDAGEHRARAGVGRSERARRRAVDAEDSPGMDPCGVDAKGDQQARPRARGKSAKVAPSGPGAAMVIVAPLHWYYTPSHLEHVIEEMRRRGAPRLRAYHDNETGVWFAREGTHRLRAALALNLIPVLKPIEWWRGRQSLERARYAAIRNGHVFRAVRVYEEETSDLAAPVPPTRHERIEGRPWIEE